MTPHGAHLSWNTRRTLPGGGRVRRAGRGARLGRVRDGTGAQDAAGADRRRRRLELPRTSTAGLDAAGAGERVFDPAPKHFADGCRIADTAVAPALRPAWQAARRTALDVAARGVARSGWADALVLRGSMLMSGWFGAAAREPHDPDFVVVPQDRGIEEPRTGRLLTAVAEAAERVAAEEGGLVMPAGGAVCEDIWTYERVPGRRWCCRWLRSRPRSPGCCCPRPPGNSPWPGSRCGWSGTSTRRARTCTTRSCWPNGTGCRTRCSRRCSGRRARPLSRTGTWSSSTSRTSPGEEVFPARLVEALRPTFPDAA